MIIRHYPRSTSRPSSNFTTAQREIAKSIAAGSSGVEDGEFDGHSLVGRC
jgi:hypothetical protein